MSFQTRIDFSVARSADHFIEDVRVFAADRFKDLFVESVDVLQLKLRQPPVNHGFFSLVK